MKSNLRFFPGALCAVLSLSVALVRAAEFSPKTAPPESRTLIEWTFDHDGDLRGWQPNGQLADVKVAGGALTWHSEGSDPILELRPSIAVPTSPWQMLEIRLRADRDGEAEFFWSNTTQGQYGGFSQEKTTRFRVIGDNQWRVYRLLPFWHPEGKIVRLRFDPYGGATFAVEFIRIVELGMPAPSEGSQFDLTKGAQGWQAINGAHAAASKTGLAILCQASEGLVLAPPVQIDAEDRAFVSLVMAVDRGKRATLFFATEKARGMRSYSFPIQADGLEHRYNLDMLNASDWRGRVIALGLMPTDAAAESVVAKAGAGPVPSARLRSFSVDEGPQGEPQLKVVSFALEDGLPRAGVPAALRALIANQGGETATNVDVRLRLPGGVRLLDASPANRSIATLGFDEEAAFTWKVEARKPVTGLAGLRLSADNAKLVEARAELSITAPLDVPPLGYVPEPKPVRGPYEVGAYYFPGWQTASQWHPLVRFPERKPLLGWYREGAPEVADWHIKWAVEHGITFFAYDWYWSQGSRQLEHALHDGFFKARYHNLLKFCLLWANHNAPHTSSLEDCRAVTQYWIHNYFHRSEYLTLGGKPIIIIFSTDRLTADLGSAKVKEAFDAMRAECRQAGLPGLYLMACVGDAGQARQAAAEGYDAVTAYNWPGLGIHTAELYAPFETLLEGYRRNWAHIIEQSPVPLCVPVCGGWDSRPWHGDNNLVRFGRTPELFRRHLVDAKRVLELRATKPAPLDMILIEAWNEWGEGSYIEPHKEFAFGYLDAIRETMTDAPKMHMDVTPADVGLGPYEVPPAEPGRTSWEFTKDAQGWDNIMDLTKLGVAESSLTGQTTGNDPAFFGPPMQASARSFSSVVVRMRLRRLDGQPFRDKAQFFWRTSRLAESESSSLRFDVEGDDQWHDYRIPVAENRRWRGLVTRLRLDPCNQAGVLISLGSIRLER